MPSSRNDRQSGNSKQKGDCRFPSQIDRDRILYSMPFRRLAGVTQVVSPGEGEVFHNRLTHSIKVAQIARRLAERLGRHFPEIARDWGGLDPEVAESAALAHDLGHPPFGHTAEEELDRLIVQELGRRDRRPDPSRRGEGYEGNAQSFRILTELAVRRPESTHGLDLTRATLNATLKYPWMCGENPSRPLKYGVYACDAEAFHFAREGAPEIGGQSRFVRSLEAQIMDWSDDIAYSVHDAEDFYRAGLIPLDRLASNVSVRERFYREIPRLAEREGVVVTPQVMKIFNNLFSRVRLREPYTGTREQTELLYDFTSWHINKFVSATRLQSPPNAHGEALVFDPAVGHEVFLLKQLIWVYVIENPSLASHRLGQRKAIRTLFHEFNLACRNRYWALFPEFFRERAQDLYEQHKVRGQLPVEHRVRLVADTIASLTDSQASHLYQQFSGVALGSVLVPIVR